jgi:MFS family permease
MAGFAFWETRAEEPLIPLSLFQDPTFRVSSLLGMLVAMALFGVIIFVPVFLQVAKGVSATDSGLRTVPIMVGIVATAIFAGRTISKTGQYHFYPIIGTAAIAIGLFLISRFTGDANLALISICLFVIGLGVGLVMQVTLLAVQNSVDFLTMGSATCGVTFFRSMGGAFGVAIFGSIFNNRGDYHLPRLIPADSLQGIDSSTLLSSPQELLLLPPEVLNGVRESFSQSLETVFLLSVPLALLAFAISWFLPHVPLRERSVPVSQPGGGAPDDRNEAPVVIAEA